MADDVAPGDHDSFLKELVAWPIPRDSNSPPADQGIAEGSAAAGDSDPVEVLRDYIDLQGDNNGAPQAIAALNRIAEERRLHGWRPMESAPTDGPDILAMYSGGEVARCSPVWPSVAIAWRPLPTPEIVAHFKRAK